MTLAEEALRLGITVEQALSIIMPAEAASRGRMAEELLATIMTPEETEALGIPNTVWVIGPAPVRGSKKSPPPTNTVSDSPPPAPEASR